MAKKTINHPIIRNNFVDRLTTLGLSKEAAMRKVDEGITYDDIREMSIAHRRQTGVPKKASIAIKYDMANMHDFFISQISKKAASSAMDSGGQIADQAQSEAKLAGPQPNDIKYIDGKPHKYDADNEAWVLDDMTTKIKKLTAPIDAGA